MKNTMLLRDKADAARTEFLQSFTDMSNQLVPMQLLNQAIGTLDPGFNKLERLQKKMQRNPIAVMAVVTSIFLIAHQFGNNRSQKTAQRLVTRTPRLTSAFQKGDEHGYHLNAKQH
jgi:hypothetical protein